MIWFPGKLTGSAKDRVQQVGQNLSQKGEEIAKTQAFQTMSNTARAVKEEIGNSALSGAGMRVYRAPTALRMRTERNPEAEERIMAVIVNSSEVKVLYFLVLFVRFMEYLDILYNI